MVVMAKNVQKSEDLEVLGMEIQCDVRKNQQRFRFLRLAKIIFIALTSESE